MSPSQRRGKKNIKMYIAVIVALKKALVCRRGRGTGITQSEVQSTSRRLALAGVQGLAAGHQLVVTVCKLAPLAFYDCQTPVKRPATLFM